MSAAADYTTASTIEIGLFMRRLDAIYAHSPESENEIADIVDDTRRGKANLGVPPGRGPGQAQVLLDPEAIVYRSAMSVVEGYVLVRRQLVSYSGDRMPVDVIPVPFVVRRLDGDWKLTADAVAWSPPPVPTATDPTTEGGWRALLPTR